ncbi:MAG: flippase-like domain-containing protein [Clostridia bacterium]|nr:flippase-like domain-containing protein [Clostridia bacterium]
MSAEREDGVYAEKPSRSTSQRKRYLRAAGVLAFIAVNALVLFFTARSDFSRPGEKLSYSLASEHSLRNAACALGCVALALAAETIKYLLMMKRLKHRLSLRTAFEATALGKYYDFVTPFGTGGQPFQIWYLHSSGYSGGAASAMPLAEYITKQSAIVLMCLAALSFGRETAGALGIRIAAYAGLLAYLLVPAMVVISALSPSASARIVGFFVHVGAKLRLLRHPERTVERIEAALTRYSDSLKRLAAGHWLFAVLFALSLVGQAALFSIPYFVLRVFGGHTPYLQAVCMCVYVYASTTIVPTPGNAGAAEGSFYLLFEQMEGSGLFWAMLAWRFCSYYIFILLGLVIYAVKLAENAFSSRRHE